MTICEIAPGERELQDFRGQRAVGSDGCCYVEHVIYRATEGRKVRDVSKKLKNAIERDLLIWCDMKDRVIFPVACSAKRARIQFSKDAAYEWLDAGGRAWIRCQLGDEKSAQIIEFPGPEGAR